MILKLINHNEEYAVREITASFFPKIKFEFSQNTSDDDYVVSEYINVINNKPDVRLCLATGINNYEKVMGMLKEKGITPGKNIEIKKYIDNMNQVMNAADILICRSGAITLSEICALGKPSVLIPSPYVTNNHQEYNAKALSDNGAAIMISERDLNVSTLSEQIDRLLSDEQLYNNMSINAKKMSTVTATDIIYNKLKELASAKQHN